MIKYSLELMQQYLNIHHNGAICLKLFDIGCPTRVIIKCENGHEWNTRYNHIIDDTSWCPYCPRKNKEKEINLYLEKYHMGAKLISIILEKNRYYLNICCERDHIIKIREDKLFINRWCNLCIKEDYFNDLVLLLKNEHPNSFFISDKYISSTTKLQINCGNGHIFDISPSKLKSGKWCAKCSEGRNEKIVRHCFNTLFDNHFVKCRPKWLIGNKNYVLELDGYCEKLNLAFEYQGIQHFEMVSKFKTDKKRLLDIQERDQTKRNICKKYNVFLIEIPYFKSKYSKYHLKDFIINWCKDNNFILPANYDQINIDYTGM